MKQSKQKTAIGMAVGTVTAVAAASALMMANNGSGSMKSKRKKLKKSAGKMARNVGEIASDITSMMN